jgi:hypothetical protein
MTRLYQSEKINTGEAVKPDLTYAPATQKIPSSAPPMRDAFILLFIATPSGSVPIHALNATFN